MVAWGAVILAAGLGTRMKSRVPKVLHLVAGRPLLCYVVQAVRAACAGPTVVVVGKEAAGIRAALGSAVLYAEQARPLGTAHALQQARPFLEKKVAQVLVSCGDVPLITPLTLTRLMAHHLETGATATILTAQTEDTEGLGRIQRSRAGRVVGIVEEGEAGTAEKAITEINSGLYCFDSSWLWPSLDQIKPSRRGELYLTDLVRLATRGRRKVETVLAPNAEEVLGVNHRLHLARAEAALRQRLRDKWMLAGVTLLDPPSTFIDDTVEIGPDTVLYPNTMLTGATRIGRECRLGPNTLIADSILGEGCRIVASVVEGSTLEEGVEVGPFSHLRPESYLEGGVHLGNFAEVKKSRLGRGTQMGHFSYMGDATVGEKVNIGAGTITCNFDGVAKHRTTIGDEVFLGSDTMLIAPVSLGPRAVTGAGAVVNRDVPADTLAVGVPARHRPRKPKLSKE